MLLIDGSQGEGGGQILRTALALSLVTGKPFRITHLRNGRDKPGLLQQHVTAVEAAVAVGQAQVQGGNLGSLELTFEPGQVTPGEYCFALDTAGSVTLVLQTVLPPLLHAAGPSQLTLCGGTHNPHAPPFDFLAKTFAPELARMAGAGPAAPTEAAGGAPAIRPLTVQLVRAGYYPAGGGEMTATITPPATWQPVELLERGKLLNRAARAVVARLAPEIARRELGVVRRELGWPESSLRVEEVRDSAGPGNVLMLELEYERMTEVLINCGARGAPSEAVATGIIAQVRRHQRSTAPVGEYLADQLLLPLALGCGGTFRTTSVTPHAQTNMETIRAFLEVTFETQREDSGDWRVTVKKAPGTATVS